MDLALAKKEAAKILRQAVNANKKLERSKLLQKRKRIEWAFEAIVMDMGFRDLLVGHEITRRKCHKWVWRKIKKDKKRTRQSSEAEQDKRMDS